VSQPVRAAIRKAICASYHVLKQMKAIPPKSLMKMSLKCDLGKHYVLVSVHWVWLSNLL